MIEIQDRQQCCGCQACVNICPRKCISMEFDEEGFSYPKVNIDECIKCNACDNVCPMLNSVKICEREQRIYVAVNKDFSMRNSSSSGGVFGLLAKNVLDKEGIVFGAALDDQHRVCHKYISSMSEIRALQGAKYAQSDVRSTYKKAKDFLDEDKWVLFAGTPCQIEGLLNYLHKEYAKLLTVDVICHGVPSPILWEKHLSEISSDHDSPRDINFRDKTYGWKTSSLKVKFANGDTYLKTHREDPYFRLYHSDLCLRRSCYNCNFRNIYRRSDITLGDCWGIDNITPRLNDNRGASVIIVHSQNGEDYINAIKGQLDTEHTTIDNVIKYNPSVAKNVPSNEKRDEFMRMSKTHSVKELNDYFCKMTPKEKVKNTILKVMGRLKH